MGQAVLPSPQALTFCALRCAMYLAMKVSAQGASLLSRKWPSPPNPAEGFAGAWRTPPLLLSVSHMMSYSFSVSFLATFLKSESNNWPAHALAPAPLPLPLEAL